MSAEVSPVRTKKAKPDKVSLSLAALQEKRDSAAERSQTPNLIGRMALRVFRPKSLPESGSSPQALARRAENEQAHAQRVAEIDEQVANNDALNMLRRQSIAHPVQADHDVLDELYRQRKEYNGLMEQKAKDAKAAEEAGQPTTVESASLSELGGVDLQLTPQDTVYDATAAVRLQNQQSVTTLGELQVGLVGTTQHGAQVAAAPSKV